MASSSGSMANMTLEDIQKAMAAGFSPQVLEILRELPYSTVAGFPAGQPPNGTIPRYDDPPRQDALSISILVICTLLTVVAAGLRLYAKAWCVRVIMIEDWLGLAFFIAQMISTGAMCAMIAERLFFVHSWDMRLGDLERLNYLTLIYSSGQALVMMFAKSAILWEWIRIFVPRRKRGAFYYIGLCTLGINLGSNIAALFTLHFSCIPWERISRVWIEGRCIAGRYESYIVLGVISLVGHLMILLLPQPIIWRLYLPAKRRFGISVMFSSGILACAAASGRLAWIIQMDYVDDITGGTADWSYDLSTMHIWGLVEMMCLALVFCVPAIPRIFSQGVTILPMKRAKSSKIQDSTDTWPLTVLPPSQKKSYQKMPEGQVNSQPIMGSVSSHTSLSNDTYHNGILKVVEITMEEEQASGISRDRLLHAQHPWDVKQN